MRILYLDCFSGISGNMTLAALLDLGLEQAPWREAIAGLGLDGVEVELTTVEKAGVRALHANVHYPPDQHHRGLSDVLGIVDRASLPGPVQDRAHAIFRRLAEAEAQVHGVDVETVHFHEVGAVDAIVDVVSAAFLLEQLQVDRVVASPVRLGKGTVEAAHGILPIPAPATALLLKGIPTYAGEVHGELCTPTGAAILAATADEFSDQPLMRVEKVGYGAGTLDLPMPNCVRVLVGESTSRPAREPNESFQEQVVELVCQIDDMTGEEIGYLSETLLAGPALDVISTPIQMKKSRPAQRLSILAPPGVESAVLDLLFRNSTTLGCRLRTETRVALRREMMTVATPWGRVGAKRTIWEGTPRFHPEYEDCARVARQGRVSVGEVLAAARRGEDPAPQS